MSETSSKRTSTDRLVRWMPGRRVHKHKDTDSTANLLRQLSSMDSCEASTVTDAEQRDGEAPMWAEIKLVIERDGKGLVHYFRRHDGELLIEVLYEVLHPYAKTSIYEGMWADLDKLMDRIMTAKKPDPADRAQALGIASCLARVKNPYQPDVNAIRKEASERWEERQ